MTPARPILLVEDQDMDAQLVLMILRERGLENIATVNDGSRALDYLFRRGEYADRLPQEPALVLLDLKMPGVSGWQVLESTKKHPCLRMIPIVVLTSSADAQDIERAYELGANAYLVKQLDFDRYSDMITTCTRFWLLFNEPPPGSVRPRAD